MKLQDKVALITGGNSGIGLATAKLFAQEGAQVAIVGRNAKTLDAAAKALGPKAMAINVDVSDWEAVHAAVQKVGEHYGKIDIVFANAGIAAPTPVGPTTAAAFDAIWRTNVSAAFATVQAASKYLQAGGAVVFNSSIHALVGAPYFSAYAASKAGLRAMTRTLASEFAPMGVRVNAVVPGATRTPIWKIEDEAAMEVLVKGMERFIPLGKVIEAEDIAHAVLFLASDDARAITAQELVVDGGHSGAPSGAPLIRKAGLTG